MTLVWGIAGGGPLPLGQGSILDRTPLVSVGQEKETHHLEVLVTAKILYSF